MEATGGSEPPPNTQAQPAATPPPEPPSWQAGWYENPAGDGQGYYDGERWTESYAPATHQACKDLLWALALGFGATGAGCAIAIPIMAFYFPLALGIGSAALIVAAATTRGNNEWWAVLAVVGCLISLGVGFAAYNDYDDNLQSIDNILED